jgi:hypothetical protein
MAMPFNNESHFEAHLCGLFQSDILPQLSDCELLGGKKGVDICIVRNAPRPAIFFLEVKYFNRGKNHSMIAVGRGRGLGFQPAVLSQRPDYLEVHLRWVLGTADNDRYYFLTTAQLLRHASGLTIGEKHNGIKRSVFSNEFGLREPQFIDEAARWLRSS